MTTAAVQLGDFEISLIRDSAYWMDGGSLFGVVPKTLWGQKCPADELNRIPLGFNSYLIRTGDHTVLVETGPGDKLDAVARGRYRMPPRGEPLADILSRHGVDPESIDTVINSHLHWDHVSGNTILKGNSAVASLPRARYFAQRGEWMHAHERHPRDSVSYIDANYDPLVESGQMTLVDGDHEVAPGVWMRRAPGHNRDLTIVTAESQGQTFAFLSDMAPFAAHLKPTWVPALDLYPLESIATKEHWLSAAVDGRWVCGFGHDTTLAFARIVRDPKNGFAVA